MCVHVCQHCGRLLVSQECRRSLFPRLPRLPRFNLPSIKGVANCPSPPSWLLLTLFFSSPLLLFLIPLFSPPILHLALWSLHTLLVCSPPCLLSLSFPSLSYPLLPSPLLSSTPFSSPPPCPPPYPLLPLLLSPPLTSPLLCCDGVLS